VEEMPPAEENCWPQEFTPEASSHITSSGTTVGEHHPSYSLDGVLSRPGPFTFSGITSSTASLRITWERQIALLVALGRREG
jgi:hypothetical protein